MKRLDDIQARRAALRLQIAASRQVAGAAGGELRMQAGAALLGLSVARLFGRKTIWRSLLGMAAGSLAAAALRAFKR